MAKNRTSVDVVIANGATTSTAISMDGARIPLAIQLPAALTGTVITFQASVDSGVTYTALYDESTLYSLTVSTSRWVALKRSVFDAVTLVRLISGSTEGGTRTIQVISGE